MKSIPLFLALALSTSALATRAEAAVCKAESEYVSTEYGTLASTELACILSIRVKTILNTVRDNVDPDDYSRIWMPLRTASTKASIALEVNDVLSTSVSTKLTRLIALLRQMEPELDRLLRIQSQEGTAEELMKLAAILEQKMK